MVRDPSRSRVSDVEVTLLPRKQEEHRLEQVDEAMEALDEEIRYLDAQVPTHSLDDPTPCSLIARPLPQRLLCCL